MIIFIKIFPINTKMDSDLEKFTKCDIFTPDNISLIMSSKLKKNGNLLEPSVGDGNLLKQAYQNQS